jgi:hypothetical protein
MKSMTVRGSGCGAQAVKAAASSGAALARRRNPDFRREMATGTDTFALDAIELT